MVSEFQRRAGLQVDGIAGPDTPGRLGLNFDQPAPLPTDRPFFYCASGTWATAASSVRPALLAGHTGSRRSFKRLWRLNG